MPTPRGSRPHMPGYGIWGPTEGRGVLPWSWAENPIFRVRPRRAFGLIESADEFAASATRWDFEG